MNLEQAVKTLAKTVHPKVKQPLVPPKNWDRMIPLMSHRRFLGFSLGDIAAAMGLSYSRVAAVESASTPANDAFVERYRAALEMLVGARLGRGASK